MTEITRRIIPIVALVLLLTSICSRAESPEFIPVDVMDIKKSPQMYWAKGIVFRAVLDEVPKGKLVTIDGRDVIRFKTRELGDVYAEQNVVDRIKELELGKEYLFSGVIGQTKRTYFGGGGDYFAIIQKVAEQQVDASKLPDSIEKLNLGNTTNIYNMVFITLDQIMRAVEKDMFASVNSEGLTVQQIFDPAKPQLDKMKTSVRKVLREVEENSKLPLEEYFVSLIISFMALQHGYVEEVHAEFQPDAVTEEYSPAMMNQEVNGAEVAITKEAWDLSEKSSEVAPDLSDAAVIVPEAEVVVPEAEVEKQNVSDAMENVNPESETGIIEAPDVNGDESAIPADVQEASEAAIEPLSADPVAPPEEITEDVIAVENVEVETAGTEEPASAVSQEISDEEMWGVSASPDAVTDEKPAEVAPVSAPAETVVEAPVIETDATVVTGDVPPVVVEPVLIPEEAPDEQVIEEKVKSVELPAAAEIKPEPAPEEKSPAKKPAKKKKSEKKKQVQESEAETTPAPISPQDEIDYSKPMRIR